MNARLVHGAASASSEICSSVNDIIPCPLTKHSSASHLFRRFQRSRALCGWHWSCISILHCFINCTGWMVCRALTKPCSNVCTEWYHCTLSICSISQPISGLDSASILLQGFPLSFIVKAVCPLLTIKLSQSTRGWCLEWHACRIMSPVFPCRQSLKLSHLSRCLFTCM